MTSDRQPCLQRFGPKRNAVPQLQLVAIVNQRHCSPLITLLKPHI